MDLNSECIFCSIAEHKVASTVLFETDKVMIIQDIMPKAPVHLQIISRKHIPSLNGLTDEEKDMISEMIFAAREQAVKSGVAESGYKIVINTGKEGGQIIPHLHMHLLGGKQLEE